MTDTIAALDEQTFSARVEPHRRELHVHCYRMLGSFEEAEDLVQEAFLRAWRRRETYAGRASLRAWLYRIATNACLDALDKRPRQPTETGEVLWLTPYPDVLLEELPDRREGPEAVVVANETIELAFIAAIQHLPPLQRAVLILRDVLACSAAETAMLLETTEPAANSALQRARGALRDRLPAERTEWQPAAEATGAERELLARYMAANDAADPQAFVDLLREDVTFSMPPTPGLWAGRDTVIRCWIDGGFGADDDCPASGMGDLRGVYTHANGQHALAVYARKPGEDWAPMALDVLAIDDGLVSAIITFDGSVFERFGLPPTLEEPAR